MHQNHYFFEYCYDDDDDICDHGQGSVSSSLRNHPSGRPFSELSDHKGDIDVGGDDDDKDGLCHWRTLKMTKYLLCNVGAL